MKIFEVLSIDCLIRNESTSYSMKFDITNIPINTYLLFEIFVMSRIILVITNCSLKKKRRLIIVCTISVHITGMIHSTHINAKTYLLCNIVVAFSI